VEQMLQQGGDQGAWLAQINELTADLPASAAGDLLYHLGQQYIRVGNWPLAAEVLERLHQEHPQHPLSGAAAGTTPAATTSTS